MIKQLLLAVFTLCSIIVTAQTPQAINYQAVARTVDGKIIPVQPVNVRFTIRNTTTTGTILYQENHLTTTNSYGLFTLAIGTGTNTTGNFSTIDWGTGFKYLTVEFASNSTTNYTIMGTTQLLSVPYALYSEKTKLIAGAGITITNGNIITATSAGLVYTGTNGVQVTGTVISGAYTAGNAINITGSTIAANYVGSNGVAVTGNSITGAYTAGNAINITGSTIAANYVGSNGVAVTGNSITGAYTAGTGIGISGGVISNTANNNNFWVADASGINYQPNNVGIGQLSNATNRLSVRGVATNPNTLSLNTAYGWQTSVEIANSSVSDYRWYFVVGGNDNTIPGYGVGQKNFGIVNGRYGAGTSFPVLIDNNDNVGINFGAGGSASPVTANLHVKGTVRLQGLPSGSGNNLVVDASGNVYRSNTFSSKSLNNDVEELKKEVAELRQIILEMKQQRNK